MPLRTSLGPSGVRAYLPVFSERRAPKIATMNGLRPVGRPMGKDPQFFLAAWGPRK